MVKCDLCENEATVHEMTISGGVPLERHLCEDCARDAGLVNQQPIALKEILEQISQGEPAPASAPRRADACPTCGTTFAEFKQSGRLGCPDCYRAYEAQLMPILDRAHGGATHHVGKVPRRATEGISDPDDVAQREVALARAEARAAEIRRLRDELDRSVRAEEYEAAARLRDRIRKLQRGAQPTDSKGDPA